MLPPHLSEGLVGALHDALATDVDPRARGHLTEHGESAPVEFVEVLPGRPVRYQVRVRNQYPRRIRVGVEDPDRLTGLNQQSFILLQRLQGFDDSIEAVPIARGAADAAVDHELARGFRNLGIEDVHTHTPR